MPISLEGSLGMRSRPDAEEIAAFLDGDDRDGGVG